MGSLHSYLAPVIAEVRARRPIRTGSLVITVFGDIVVPRGGVVWLGSLVELLAPFGVSYGQIRTAVSRLRTEDWLASEAWGRKSFVRLTDHGQRRLAEATSRIYGSGAAPWSGRWTVLLFPAGLSPRHPVRTALGWLGFGTLSPQVFLHPNPDPQGLGSVLDDARRQLPPDEAPIEIDGEGTLGVPLDHRHPALDRLVASSWSFEPLEAAYQRFVNRFRPVTAGLAPPIDPEEAVALRLALIHDFRRILLRDPGLPEALQPPGWIGQDVRALVAEIYQAILGPSETWISDHLVGPQGPLPHAPIDLARRFQP
ncbi:MAG: PaaX family transcriptional regulator C-terminal domain-containing protein [Myxococcota bacterium]